MKIHLTTLGCPKNLVDSEHLLGGLQGDSVEFVADPTDADTIILNTCGFIQGAKEESIDAILQAISLKKEGTCSRVFVTGCLSQRYPDELQQELPEVDGFYGNRDMNQILRELTSELDLRREILGERLLATPSHYAYLKISEGCENPCTFCSIPGIRGAFKSRPLEALAEEAGALARKGVRELILIAQDSTVYGRDLYDQSRLVELLASLSEIDELKWIRLLYTYPAHFSEELIGILSEKKDVLKYVDMPVQHASNRLLQRMARKTTREAMLNIVESLRKNNPEVALRSTVISGFPGESEADHEELCDFLEEARFDRLGVFAYSPEEDTPAFVFSGAVPEHVVQERLAQITDIQNQISWEKNEALVGKTLEVVIDEFDDATGTYLARTHYDCPEIDNSVSVRATALAPGQFCEVKVTGCSDYSLDAEFVSEKKPTMKSPG